MTDPIDPSNLGLSDLIVASRQELASFRARQRVDGDFGFELFRRALEGRQERAWSAVVELYGLQVRRWVGQHSGFHDLARDVDDIAIPAFVRMWKAVTPGRLSSFNGLAALLQFLKTCVHSEIMQAHRERARHECLEQLHLDTRPDEDDPWSRLLTDHDLTGATLEDDVDRQRFWRRIMALLRGDQERLVVECTFALGLPPREIADLHPQLFSGAAEVSRIKENVLRRLRRSLGGEDDKPAPETDFR